MPPPFLKAGTSGLAHGEEDGCMIPSSVQIFTCSLRLCSWLGFKGRFLCFIGVVPGGTCTSNWIKSVWPILFPGSPKTAQCRWTTSIAFLLNRGFLDSSWLSFRPSSFTIASFRAVISTSLLGSVCSWTCWIVSVACSSSLSVVTV